MCPHPTCAPSQPQDEARSTPGATTISAAGEEPRPRRARLAVQDGVLVELAQGGDEEAYEELVRRYQTPAYRIALRLTGSAMDAQDATQDAFLRAWRALASFRGDADFGTWLTRILINTCHSQRRRARPTEPLVEQETAGRADEHPRAPAAEAVALAAQRDDAVQRAVGALPFSHRAPLVLHVFAGHSHAEVGRVLGISEGAAKVRVHRARQALAETLREWR